jgi:hypothetical protein
MLKPIDIFGRALKSAARSSGVFVARYQPDHRYVDRTLIWEPEQKFSCKDRQTFELFYSVAKPVVEAGRTLLDYERLYILWQAARWVHKLKLPVAEIGSYRGGSAYFLAKAFKVLAGEELPVHVFDTFEGHPAKISEQDTFHVAGFFGDTSYEEVKAYLAPFSRVDIHKGEISESIKTLDNMSYGLVHIDVDIYQSTLDCLNYFGARLAGGGVIVLDDFESRKCPGVRTAVIEYLRKENHFQLGRLQTEQLMLFKKASPESEKG